MVYDETNPNIQSITKITASVYNISNLLIFSLASPPLAESAKGVTGAYGRITNYRTASLAESAAL